MSSFDNSKRITAESEKPDGGADLDYQIKKILIVAKTIPNLSKKYRETVCTAGITDKGEWIRLYPISYRYLDRDKLYKKYQWIEIEVKKHDPKRDKRVDSFRPKEDSIKLLNLLSTSGKNGWDERNKVVLPTISKSLEKITEDYGTSKKSLGIFKPSIMHDLLIKPAKSDLNPRKKAIKNQLTLGFTKQTKELETCPYEFSYKFSCDDPKCKKTHALRIIDWEIYELYRSLKNNYEYSIDVILSKIKEKFLKVMWADTRDSYLIVGTIFPYNAFVVLGVYWPPKK